MIVIENVLPNARELRACASSWKSMARLAWVQILSLFALLIANFIVASIYATEEAAIWVGATMAIVLFVLIAVGMFVSTMNARVAARAAKDWGPMRWTLDQEGARIEGVLTTTVFKWKAVRKAFEDGDRFIFALSPSSNAVLPRRFLAAGQAETLRDLIADLTASGRLSGGVD